MDKKCKTPQIFLGRFACGGGTEKRTFRFTSRNASSYFFGTLRFADYISIKALRESYNKKRGYKTATFRVLYPLQYIALRTNAHHRTLRKKTAVSNRQG